MVDKEMVNVQGLTFSKTKIELNVTKGKKRGKSGFLQSESLLSYRMLTPKVVYRAPQLLKQSISF